MAGETQITLVGNLTEDPNLRFTSGGIAVAEVRVASTPRAYDKASGEWKDGEPMFLSCTAWRQAAENVAESLKKGARVIVVGRLKQRSYETQQGDRRTVFEVDIEEIGPALKYATAQVTRTTGGGGGQRPAAGGGQDPWASQAPAAEGNDPWAVPQSEEPPF